MVDMEGGVVGGEELQVPVRWWAYWRCGRAGQSSVVKKKIQLLRDHRVLLKGHHVLMQRQLLQF